jgi:HEPN domain-containing protein
MIVSPEAEGWLAFAAGDLRAARLLLSDATVPSRIACFHAQQAVEKALKAVLIAESIVFRKTHDITVLVGLTPSTLATELAYIDVLLLQPWAVDGRYPGDLPDASAIEAAEVVEVAATVLATVELWLTANF